MFTDSIAMSNFDEDSDFFPLLTNLDEDKIIRKFADLIQATLRTNFYQITKEGNDKKYLSFI